MNNNDSNSETPAQSGENNVNTHHKKVLIITQFWATIYGSLLTAGIVASVAFAWNANAQMAVLSNDVAIVKSSDINSRLARIEAQLDILLRQKYNLGR